MRNSEQYRFDRAASVVYQFIWHEYCDWYLELAKPALQNPSGSDAKRTRHTLLETCETMMRLLHPFTPFLTEEIWQTLPHEGESIVVQSYPMPRKDWRSPDAEALFSLLERSVTLMRTGRSLLNYSPAKSVDLFVMGAHDQNRAEFELVKGSIGHLAKGRVQITSADHAPSSDVLRLTDAGVTVGISLDADVDLVKALDRIKKQKDEFAKEAGRLSGKLTNPEFTGKAPPEVIQEHKARLQLLAHDEDILQRSEDQLREFLRHRSA